VYVGQIAGNRNDVHGLYALLATDFQGLLLADNGYWPNPEKRFELLDKGIRVLAQTRSNMKIQHDEDLAKWLRKRRGAIERKIGLFDQHFNAGETICRSKKHYEARRLCKALAHNGSRYMNRALGKPIDSLVHYHATA